MTDKMTDIIIYGQSITKIDEHGNELMVNQEEFYKFMISETDRRILAEACGLEIVNIDVPYTIGGRVAWKQELDPCLSFTSPADWELVRTKVIIPNFNEFVAYIWKEQVDYTGGVHDAFAYWLTLSPEECCQLAADFLKEKG